MCETNAYVHFAKGEELLLDGIDIVRPENGSVYLRSLFGEERHFKGRIKEIQLSKHRIVLEGIE